MREFGISSKIADKANNEIYEQVITPLNNEIEELNKDVEYQALQRQNGLTGHPKRGIKTKKDCKLSLHADDGEWEIYINGDL